MKLLESWVATPAAAAVGWALIHSLWQGAVLALVLCAVLLATRDARVRYGAGCALMLLILCAFTTTLVIELPADSRSAAKPAAAFPVWDVQPPETGSGYSSPMLSVAAPWLAPIWIAGVLIVYIVSAGGWLSVSRLRRRGVCSASDEWRHEIARWSAAMRITRPVQLLESCLVEVPVVLGHFRPVILLPAGLIAGLPAAQVQAILLHELAHIRRSDYLVNIVQRALAGLLFYHPAIWWISSVITTERENCCDDFAVRAGGDVHGYTAALAALEENRQTGRQPALAATGGKLVKRIRRLLNPKSPSGAFAPFAAAVLLIAVTAGVVSAWQGAPAQSASQAPSGSPWAKWLNEDVVYIINAEERGAFERLATDEERQHFIEQFWMRRDPTPGTADNEFKTEHYRRIAYANRKFAATNPGWRTDRGHIYIVYGPPDEIETHAQRKPYPTEVWLYRRIEGIGDDLTVLFIDRSGSGDYILAPGKGR